MIHPTVARLVLPLALLAPVQAPQTITLPAGVTGPAFLGIGDVRELQDGRTLVADKDDRFLFVVDWRTGQSTKVGRHGDGPGEYQYPGHLVALPGDSTLLIDSQARNWLFMAGARIGGKLLRDQPIVRFIGRPVGADSLGRLLAVLGSHYPPQFRNTRGPGAEARAESLAVVLVDRRDGAPDTLSIVRGPYLGENAVKARVPSGMIT